MSMTTTPLFSVLIANYNNGNYLMSAIDSVRKQMYTNWEIIIVDDCSTDNSCELYKNLTEDTRIKIYYNETNCGCGYTKRRCVELANGELCGFLDPDDELLPNALLDSKNALLKDEKNVLSFSRFYFCDENMNIVGECRPLQLKDKSYFENHDYYPEHFVAFKSAAYQQTIGIDPHIKAAVDQDMYFKIEEVGQIVVLNKFTYKYRKNPKALTSISYWCEYWNILVRHNTCMRRGLNVDQYSFKDFNEIIKYQTTELPNKKLIDEIVASQIEEKLWLNELNIRSSITYRIGYILLIPYRLIKKWFKL